MGYRQILVIHLSIWFIKLIQNGAFFWFLGILLLSPYRLVTRTLSWTQTDFIFAYQILHVIIIISRQLGFLDLINFFSPSLGPLRESLYHTFLFLKVNYCQIHKLLVF